MKALMIAMLFLILPFHLTLADAPTGAPVVIPVAIAPSVPAVVASGLPVIVNTLQTQAAQATVDTDSFLGSILDFILHHGGLGTPLLIACICLILIASMKVTVLDSLFWDHLGRLQAFVAPVLGIIVGLIMVHMSGPITLAAIVTYAGSGAGAVVIHELLDALKGMPGLGTFYVNVIQFLEDRLGGNPVGAVTSTSGVPPASS